MKTPSSPRQLWESIPSVNRERAPSRLDSLPNPVRRYLGHSIAPATPLAEGVRLRMRGEIRLKGWLPFRAEQVISRSAGMIWQATVRMRGVPITGFDRLLHGEGAMRWKLLGLIPLLRAAGPDITPSTAGRMAAELVWLPSALCGPDVHWKAPGRHHLEVELVVQGLPQRLRLTIDGTVRLRRMKMQRWGNPDGGIFRSLPFGAFIEDEANFGGFTIPSRLRVGWRPHRSGFGPAGEFFRVTVEEASFR